MNCVEVQTSLAENLASRDEPDVAGHLEECSDCFKVCEELLELDELSRSLSGRFKVPDNFREQVLFHVEKANGLRNWRIVLGGAVIVLLAGVITFFKPWEVNGADGNPPAGSPVFHTARTTSLPSLDSGYVEVVVPGDDGEEMIVRLPAVIEVRRTQLQEDFYLSNVSH